MDLEITIELYDKSFTEQIIAIFKKYSFDKPVYFIEYTSSLYIKFNTDYEQWEIQKELGELFEDYSFYETISNNSEAILKIHRVQSPMSTDNWGRPWNSDIITKTVYLIKNVETKSEIADSTFQVLFGNTTREYQVHLASGKDPHSGNPFYVVLKEPFATPDKAERLIQKNFANLNQAFWEGLDAISSTIEQDFEAYEKELKSQRRKKSKKQ